MVDRREIMERNRRAREYSLEVSCRKFFKVIRFILFIVIVVEMCLLFRSRDSVEITPFTVQAEHSKDFEQIIALQCQKQAELYELYTFVELRETGIRNKMLEEFTGYDIDIMARVVMSESSIEPYECKILVAKTLLNRYYSDNFTGSIYELADKGFSMQDNGEVTEECYNAVYDAFTSDDPVFYFRTDYYHSFGQPYKQVGITCFSTE